jgi:hypothetical protein
MSEDDHAESKEDAVPPSSESRLGQVARVALAEFAQLIDQSPYAVTGARPDGDGWSLLVDVVELERVPSTTSVLATYRVDTDRHGHLISYERLRRFTRNATERS